MKVGYVVLYVNDAEACRRFWVEQVGMVESPGEKVGFWRRQFEATVTRPQIIFDIVFGVIAPILCFVFDPLVFRNGFGGPALLSDYRNFVYLFSGLQIDLLCFWLLTGSGPQVWNKLIGGMFIR